MTGPRNRPALAALALLTGSLPLLLVPIADREPRKRAYQDGLATRVLVRAARALLESRQPAEAMRRLRSAQEAYPDQPALRRMAAAALEDLGRRQDALEQLVRVAPRHALGRLGLGQLALLAARRAAEQGP